MLKWAHLPECQFPPDDWTVVPFNKLVKVIAGQSPPSETYNEKGLGLPFLQGNADFGEKYPKPKAWCTSPQKVATKNDILISIRAPVGEINRADQDYAIGRGLAALRATSIDSNFLHQAIQRWRWCLQRVAQGTTFDAVTARHFAQLHVLVPPAEEQRAIAQILDATDTAIERTKEAIEQARQLKDSVLQEFLFGALGETAYADHPAKELPYGWNLIPTEDLLEIEPKNGVSPEAKTQPPGIPTFSIAAIRNGVVDLDTIEHRKYAQISEKKAKPYEVNYGDVLIVRGNANPDLVGKAGIIRSFPEGCIYPDITKRVVFKDTGENCVSPEYAVLVWNHSVVHNQILRRAKTSNGTLKINNRDVKQIVMPVAPRKEQDQLVSLVQAVDKKILALGERLTAQEQLKKALMHDLLTGKMRVNTADLASAV